MIDTKEIALLGTGVAGIGLIGYGMFYKPKQDTPKQPDAQMDAIGGASLIAGSAVFLFVILAIAIVIFIIWGVKKASEGDVDSNIDRAGKIADIRNKLRR